MFHDVISPCSPGDRMNEKFKDSRSIQNISWGRAPQVSSPPTPHSHARSRSPLLLVGGRVESIFQFMTGIRQRRKGKRTSLLYPDTATLQPPRICTLEDSHKVLPLFLCQQSKFQDVRRKTVQRGSHPPQVHKSAAGDSPPWRHPPSQNGTYMVEWMSTMSWHRSSQAHSYYTGRRGSHLCSNRLIFRMVSPTYVFYSDAWDA